jgi:CRP-like cAMP-binding protein
VIYITKGKSFYVLCVAYEDSEVLFLATEDVRRSMLDHPQAALTARTDMATKLRIVASLAEQHAPKDVSQRLATLLLVEALLASPNCRMGFRSLYLCGTRNSHRDLDRYGRW